MGSDNEYEHQAEWRDNLNYWRDKWAAEREKCIMTGAAKLEITLYAPIDISVNETRVERHGNTFIIMQVPIESSNNQQNK